MRSNCVSQALENLTGPGKPLKTEAPDANEIAGLLRAGIARLHDARNVTLALESWMWMNDSSQTWSCLLYTSPSPRD